MAEITIELYTQDTYINICKNIYSYNKNFVSKKGKYSKPQ